MVFLSFIFSNWNLKDWIELVDTELDDSINPIVCSNRNWGYVFIEGHLNSLLGSSWIKISLRFVWINTHGGLLLKLLNWPFTVFL